MNKPNALDEIRTIIRETRDEVEKIMATPLNCEIQSDMDACHGALDLIAHRANGIPAASRMEFLQCAVATIYNLVGDWTDIASPEAYRLIGALHTDLMNNTSPEPGSEWAANLGCTCHAPPVGYQDVSPPEVTRDQWCPLHGRDPDEERERAIDRRMNEANDR